MPSYPKTASAVHSLTSSTETVRPAGPGASQFAWLPAVLVAHRLVHSFGMDPATAVVVSAQCGFLVEAPHGP